jgi:hypothetical protein
VRYFGQLFAAFGSVDPLQSLPYIYRFIVLLASAQRVLKRLPLIERLKDRTQHR